MSAASAWTCFEDGEESDDDQDDASPEQEETTVLLIGDGDIADEGDRPANPIHIVSMYRERPRVADRVRIALGVEQELSRFAFGDVDYAVQDLLGGLVRVGEHDHVAHGEAVHADTLADDDAADSKPRPHAAREDR